MKNEPTHDSFNFECPLCETSAMTNGLDFVVAFQAAHMMDVHGGPYTAADDRDSEIIAATGLGEGS